MKDNLKLLIVDDEGVEREALGTFAHNDGRFTEIAQAANGVEALEKASLFRPDIIAMDIRMPGMDGLAAASAIRDFDKRTRIIFLTAFGELEYARLAFKVGADEFLLKPVSEESFKQAMDRSIEALRASGGTGGISLLEFQKLESRLLQCIRQGDEAGIEAMIDEAFYEKDFLESELPQIRNTAVWLLYQLEHELSAELGRSLPNLMSSADNLRRSRSVEEALHCFKDSLISFAKNTTSAKTDPYRHAIQIALRYIEKNWQKPISLDEVSEEAGFSRYHFSRIFRTQVGCTFSEYLCEKRLGKAKEYLADRSLPMKQVCGLSGFSNSAYFAGVFKKHMGISPSEYRSLAGAKSKAKLLIKSQDTNK